MGYELNLAYLWENPRAKIVAAEAVVGLLGGIINAFWKGIAKELLAFSFWTTMIISGSIVVLNILKLYNKLHDRIGNLLVQIEECYIGLWGIFYAISTILSFISWGLSNVAGYVELVLFAADGYFHYKCQTFPSKEQDSIQEEKEPQDGVHKETVVS